MLKREVADRLKELKLCDVIKINLYVGNIKTYKVPYKTIINYPDDECIDIPVMRLRFPYQAISSLEPID
jgi:hypothetical protein